MQEQDFPAKGGGRRRQRGFIHVMLFVMLFLGITTFGVVYLQEEVLSIQAGRQSVTQTALQEARKGLLEYARPYPGMPQRYRDTVPIDPKYNFYTHEELPLLQDDRYLVARPGQLPCPDMADTAHVHVLPGSLNYNDRFIPYQPIQVSNRMFIRINQEFMDEDDNLLDGIADPGTNMCSFAFLPRGSTSLTVYYDHDRDIVVPEAPPLRNGSFFGRYPYREHSDLINFSRGAGVRDIRDGDGNRLWYAASPNVLNAHRTINPYQIVRTGRNWLTLHLVPNHLTTPPTAALNATIIIGDVAAVVISPGLHGGLPPEDALSSRHNLVSQIRLSLSGDAPGANVSLTLIFDGRTVATVGSHMFNFAGVTGHPRPEDDEVAFITKAELLESFSGMETVNSNHLDNIADALLAYHQRNNYLPDPATFEAANALMIARRLGRPALAPGEIVDAASQDMALAALFQTNEGYAAGIATDARTSLLLGSVDGEGFRYAYQGGRVSYGYAGGQGSSFHGKGNEQLITASLSHSQAIDVYVPSYAYLRVRRNSSRTASTGFAYMLPPFGASQYLNREPARQRRLYARQGTEIVTIEPNTPLILARPVFMTPATPDPLTVGGVVEQFYNLTTARSQVVTEQGSFNVLFPDGRLNLAGNMARLGYQVYLPAGAVVRTTSTVQFLRHKTAATTSMRTQDNGRAFELVPGQTASFTFGVSGEYRHGTPSAPKNSALVPGNQGLLPTPLLPQQLPNHDPHERGGTRALDHASLNQGSHWQRQLGAVKRIPRYRGETHVVITDRRGLAFGYYPSKVKLHPLIGHSITLATVSVGFPLSSSIASARHPTVNRPVIEINPVTRFAHNGLDRRNWMQNSVEFQATTPDPATFNGWIELPVGAKFFYPFGSRVPVGPLFSQSADGISFAPGGPIVGDAVNSQPNMTITVSLPPGTVIKDMVVGLPELRRGVTSTLVGIPPAYINHEYQLVTAPGAMTIARVTLEHGGIMKFSQMLHYHNGETALQPLTPAQADFRIETMGAVVIDKEFPLTLTGITLASPFHHVNGALTVYDPQAMKKALNHVGEADQNVNEDGYQRHVRPLDEHIPLADGYYIYPYRSTFATMSRRTYPFLSNAYRDSLGAVTHTMTVELNSFSVTITAGGHRVRRYQYRRITSFIDNRGSRADVLAYATGRNRIYRTRYHDCTGSSFDSFFFDGNQYRFTTTKGILDTIVYLNSLNSVECDVVSLTVVERSQLTLDRLLVPGTHSTKGRAAQVDQFGVGIEQQSFTSDPSGAVGFTLSNMIHLNFEQGVAMQANPGRIWGGGLEAHVYLQRYGWRGDTTPLVAPFMRRSPVLGSSVTITSGAVSSVTVLDGSQSEYAILIAEDGGSPSTGIISSSGRLLDTPHDSIRFAGETSQTRNFIASGSVTVNEFTYDQVIRNRNVVQNVATLSTSSGITVQKQTIGIREASSPTPGDFRYHERRVRFSFNSDAVATDEGDGEPARATHLPRGTKLEYGVMLQPSDHNRGTCHNPALGFTHSTQNPALITATVSDATGICDNHYMPSGRLFRGVGFSPIPRRAAVVFNKPQQSIMPLAGGNMITIGLTYVQRELATHICVNKFFSVGSFWNSGPVYHPWAILAGDNDNQKLANLYTLPGINDRNEALFACQYNEGLGGGYRPDLTWMRAGSFNKTNMSVHFRTADGYGNTATIVQNSSSQDNFFDNYGRELELTLWNVHLRVPAGAAFSPTEYLQHPVASGRFVPHDSGKIFIDADVQLVATGYFPNCIRLRTDGRTTVYPMSGFLQLVSTRDPWEEECQEKGSVLLSNVIIPPARVLMDTMNLVVQYPTDQRVCCNKLLTNPLWLHRDKGKLQFYIEVEDWEDLADLQAVFPTHGGGSVIYEGSTFYGFRDYGYLWTQNHRNPRTPPSWIGDIQSNQLMLYDLMQDNEGIQRGVPQLQLSWSGRESEWNSMEFRPDSLVFAQNNPMFYAVAPECRRAAALEAQGCALEANEGLQVYVNPGQAARLPEDSLIPGGLVIHGHRGARGVSVRVNVLSSGGVTSHPGLFFHADGRVERLIFDASDIDRLAKTGVFISSTPGEEMVIYNSDNGLDFRLEEATGVSSFPLTRSPHAHGYLGSLTIIYGGHTHANAASAVLELTLAASLAMEALPGTEVFRDEAGMPRIKFGTGSQAALAGNTTLSHVGGWQSKGDSFYLTAFIEGEWVEPSHRIQPPKRNDNLGGRSPIEMGVRPGSASSVAAANFQIFTQPQIISINATPGYAWPGFLLGNELTQIQARNYATVEATVLMRNYLESGQVYGQAASILNPSTDRGTYIDLPERFLEVPIPSHYALEATSVLRTEVREHDMGTAAHATTLSGCPLCGTYTVTLIGNGGVAETDSLILNAFPGAGVIYAAANRVDAPVSVESVEDGELAHRGVTVSNRFFFSGDYQASLVAMVSAGTRTTTTNSVSYTVTTYYEDSDLVITLNVTGAATGLSMALAGTVSVEHQVPSLHFLDVEAATGITPAPGFYSHAVTVPAASVSVSAIQAGGLPIGTLDFEQLGFVLENAANYSQLLTTGGDGFTIQGPLAIHQTQERALSSGLFPSDTIPLFYRDHSQSVTVRTGVSLTSTLLLPYAAFSSITIDIENDLAPDDYSIRRDIATSLITISAGMTVTVDVVVDVVDAVTIVGGNTVTLSGGILYYARTTTVSVSNATVYTIADEERDTASYFFDESLYMEVAATGPSSGDPVVGLIVPVPEVVTDKGITILAGSLLLPNYGEYGAVLHAQPFATNGLVTMFIPPGHSEAHLIAGGGAGRPMMLTRPALVSASGASVLQSLTVSYVIEGQNNYGGGSGPVVTRTVSLAWGADAANSVLIAVKNPAVRQTIMDFRLGDAFFHRRGAKESWNPGEAPYEDDLLSRIYPYPLPYQHRLKPQGDTSHGWALEIYQHPSIAGAVTLGAENPYLLRSWQLSAIAGGAMATVIDDDGIHAQFYSGPSTARNGDPLTVAAAPDRYSFYHSLRPRFGLTTKSSGGATLAAAVMERTVVLSSTSYSPSLYDYVLSVERTTLETGLAYNAALAIDMSVGVVPPPFEGMLNDFNVASLPYNQTFWVRLSSAITMSLTPATTITLPVDTLINPVLGTYTLPFDFNDDPDFIEFELDSRARMHLHSTLRVTRPIGVLPQGITIEFNRPATFDNVKALLAYSPYPLPSTYCESMRNGIRQEIDQTSDHAHFATTTAIARTSFEIPDYIIANRIIQSQAGSPMTLGVGRIDERLYPSNVGDADICLLNDLPENTDFDREFEFTNGPLFDRRTGEEIANNRMRMVGGKLLP